MAFEEAAPVDELESFGRILHGLSLDDAILRRESTVAIFCVVALLSESCKLTKSFKPDDASLRRSLRQRVAIQRDNEVIPYSVGYHWIAHGFMIRVGMLLIVGLLLKQ